MFKNKGKGTFFNVPFVIDNCQGKMAFFISFVTDYCQWKRALFQVALVTEHRSLGSKIKEQRHSSTNA